MKSLYIGLIILFVATTLLATQLIIHKTDGTDIQVNISDIESITFGEAPYGEILLYDDFDSYEVGTFPSEGGWVIQYGGAGQNYQYISDDYSNSGSKSLRISGTSGWRAEIINEIDLSETDIVFYEASFYALPGSRGSVSLYNPDYGSWGGWTCRILFEDGDLNFRDFDPGAESIELFSYSQEEWVTVKLRYDQQVGKVDIWANGILVLEQHEMNSNIEPFGITHFVVSTNNYYGNQINYWDDLKVWTE